MASFGEFLGKVKGESWSSNAYALVLYNDRFEVLTYDELCREEIREKKLLDIRVFDENKEYRLFRDYAGSEFSETVMDDRTMPEERHEDEQYLDIDTKRSKPGTGRVMATGGGSYRFPRMYTEETKVKIRNYVKYDEFGQASLVAWRVVGFTDEEVEENV